MSKPLHFGVRCDPCGKMVAVPIPAARIDDDPVTILRSLPAKDQREIVKFSVAHDRHGDLAPCVVEIEPIPQA